jgi:hypothetical protein
MTKTIITLLLTFYSVARISVIAYYLYYGVEALPFAVLLITSACCLVCFGAAVAQYRGRLRGSTLHSVLMLVAAAALANMLILYLNPVNSITNVDLLVTGTFFDVVFYLGTLTLHFPDAPMEKRENPFVKAGSREPVSPEDEELDELVRSIEELPDEEQDSHDGDGEK